MYPVLFTLGPFAVSSFGVFLAAGFLAAVFVCWRIARAYDINEEKMLDLAILTLLLGFIFSRLFFVIMNLGVFDNPMKVLLINRYPGLSFFGGVLGGMIALFLLSRRFKLQFWQMADFAAVSLAIGLVFGDVGCLLGGCSYGLPSNLPLAVNVDGVIGKRLPLPFLESAIFFLVFLSLWGKIIRFHFQGKIAALLLIWIGMIKLVLGFYRGDRILLPGVNLSIDQLLALGLLVAGIVIFYRRAKRDVRADLLSLPQLFTSRKQQKKVLFQVQKSWYNQRIVWRIRLGRLGTGLRRTPSSLKRIFNVKSTPRNFN